MLEKRSILAIVVTYYPGSGFAERFERLAGQVDAVLIVDNNSSPEAVSMLREAAARLEMHLIRNSDNLGVAAALNVGVAYAIANGYQWALLFDQDTAPGDNMVEGLREAYHAFLRTEKIAVIGSNYKESLNGRLHFPAPATNGCSWREHRTVITSGSLVSLRAYREIGPFRDEFFADCVDHEYCLRARSKGFKVIMTTKPLMIHGVGQATSHRLLWKDVHPTNHSAWRHYYMIRNHTLLIRDYVLTEPVWAFTTLYALCKSVMVSYLFEEDNFKKMTFCVLGLWDGLFSNFDRKIRLPWRTAVGPRHCAP
jgi:rhamnosyltransferase